MAASGSTSTNPARIPALGIRMLVLLALSLLLMVLDHRQNYLDVVRKTVGVVVYPIQLVVDSPFRLWDWIRQGTTERSELQLELGRLRAERLITNARLQKLTALEAENARLRDLLDARSQVRDDIRVAEIMAVDANPYRHNIIIDVGERGRVYDGQAIVDAAGVVEEGVEHRHDEQQPDERPLEQRPPGSGLSRGATVVIVGLVLLAAAAAWAWSSPWTVASAPSTKSERPARAWT